MKVTSHQVLLRVCTLLLALAASVARASAEAPPAIDKAFVSGLLESAKADKDFREWMLSVRRELHSKPELMYEEVETSKIIQRELKKLDIPFTSGIGKTGVIGVIGTGEEPVIALRADIDALPLEEESGVPFRSQHPGRMHACGHDIHTTMLLGAGRLLKKLESSGDLGKGTIKLAFQPAEEGGAGALHIREHLKDIKAIYGFHIWPGVPTGTVASRSGTIMASAAFFKCFFKGKGTHGAMPHLGRDPVVAASAAIQALQTLVSRRTSPLDSSVVSVTQFKAGEAYNVIPDEVMIGGTMRALTEDAMELLVEGARGMVESIGAGYGMTTTCDFMEDVHPITPPVVNSKEAFHFATEVGRMMLGEENVIETEPTMGAEDFSYYTQKADGAFIFLGGGGEYPLHHPKFYADEEVLPIGAAYHTALAVSSMVQEGKNEL